MRTKIKSGTPLQLVSDTPLPATITFRLSSEDMLCLQQLVKTGFYGQSVQEAAESILSQGIDERREAEQRQVFAKLAREKKRSKGAR